MNKHAALLARTIDEENYSVKGSPAKEKVATSTAPRFSWEIDVWDTTVPTYITRFDTPTDSVTERE